MILSQTARSLQDRIGIESHVGPDRGADRGQELDRSYRKKKSAKRVVNETQDGSFQGLEFSTAIRVRDLLRKLKKLFENWR